jgi:hypothetical protein
VLLLQELDTQKHKVYKGNTISNTHGSKEK